MSISHKDISAGECHEPKQIKAATAADAGKVITPSSTNYQGELRKLDAQELTYTPGVSVGWATPSGAPDNVQDALDYLHLLQYPAILKVFDDSTVVATGTDLDALYLPFSFVITSVYATLGVAQTSGSILTVDVNYNGTSILSTKMTVDNGEISSITAATPAVMTSNPYTATSLNKLSVDVDQVGDGTAKGLKVYLLGYAEAAA